MNSIEKGDRVILAMATSPPSRVIPVRGSQFECVGTSTMSSLLLATIEWDNGFISTFFINKLELADNIIINKREDPNQAFLLRKMRDR